MNRKNDKLIIVLISMAVFLIFSWVLKISSVDTAGFLTEGSIIRLGLFELISMIFYSFQREIDVVLFRKILNGFPLITAVKISLCDSHRTRIFHLMIL